MQSLSLTSRYAWAYGNPPTSDATTNNPSDGFARHFYDEVRVLLPNDIPAGTTVTLQQDASDTAAILRHRFRRSGGGRGAGARAAREFALGHRLRRDAQRRDGRRGGDPEVHQHGVGRGQDRLDPGGDVLNDAATPLNGNVTIQGAGMWHSTIQGPRPASFAAAELQFSDLSLYGEVTLRDDDNERARHQRALRRRLAASQRLDGALHDRPLDRPERKEPADDGHGHQRMPHPRPLSPTAST